MDSFYARDIQELFSIEKRTPFLKVLEFLLTRNGNMLEATEVARVSGITRPTVVKYLEALEHTKAITLLRPFSGSSAQEIVSQPKVYGFDTGFICFAKKIKELRNEDKGELLENLTLEVIQASSIPAPLHYWRVKQQAEIDFVIPISRNEIMAIECKWQSSAFRPKNMLQFRGLYPKGKNILICADAKKTTTKNISGLEVTHVNILEWQDWLKANL